MKLIRGWKHIAAENKGVAVTIGNFDGVHKGHQALIRALKEEAGEHPLCLICFEPQPLECLRSEQAPPRLQSLAEKLEAFDALPVDQIMVLRFNQALAQMTAEQFVREILLAGLDMKCLYVGDDYRLGRNREGDWPALQALSKECGFALKRMPTITLDDERISSTRIRQLLAEGEVEAAADCLGRPYAIRGRVIHGKKLGRELGARTANVARSTKIALRYGVYCVRLNGQAAVANFGVRPSVEGEGELLEVHLLDQNIDLYGQSVRVSFEHFIRDEQRFESLDELKLAIADDVAVAKNWFGIDDNSSK